MFFHFKYYSKLSKYGAMVAMMREYGLEYNLKNHLRYLICEIFDLTPKNDLLKRYYDEVDQMGFLRPIGVEIEVLKEMMQKVKKKSREDWINNFAIKLDKINENEFDNERSSTKISKI